VVDTTSAARRRDGAATRQEALRVALALFTEHGYEATSLRQIAEALGINKASLYYHFPNKEALLRSVLEERGSEAEQLLDWCEQQPRSPALIRETVLRWVDAYSEEKLQGIRFLRANPFIGRALTEAAGKKIGDPLNRLNDVLVGLLPDPAPTDAVLVRMAILSINAAVDASAGMNTPDRDTIAAARTAAGSLIAVVLGTEGVRDPQGDS
jgi:AcrR family transcriptional regulator